jgi:Holliday junction resolvase RusA-like endonuclease
MTTIIKRIPMKPFPKKRPRVTRNGTYTPDKHLYQQFRLLFGRVPEAGMYDLKIYAVRKMPKSWNQKKRDRLRGTYATPKPDRDNVAGGVMDALFGDDSAVVDVRCSQIWGDDWEVVVRLTALEGDARPCDPTLAALGLVPERLDPHV